MPRPNKQKIAETQYFLSRPAHCLFPIGSLLRPNPRIWLLNSACKAIYQNGSVHELCNTSFSEQDKKISKKFRQVSIHENELAIKTYPYLILYFHKICLRNLMP
jgi:hypothetical protein